MNSARQFISEIAENVSIPDIYLDIRKLIKRSNAQIQDYVQLIEHDSMLSVRIIRMANSEFLGFTRKADNLTQAINLIGVIQLQDLLVSTLCMRTFYSIPQQLLNLKAFWSYSTQCGIAARVIAQHSLAPMLNHYFTLGLLHEIGHAAMYTLAPDVCVQALEESASRQRPVEELEKEYLGFDYCETGSLLTKVWQLPKVYQQVARFHLEPAKAEKDFQYEALVIHLAHSICQNPVVGINQKLIYNSRNKHPQLERLPSSIDKIIISEIEEHADNVLEILWPAGTAELSGSSHQVQED